MLSVFADLLLVGNHRDRWDAPDYFRQSHGPRRNVDVEREAAERRRRALRGVGMW